MHGPLNEIQIAWRNCGQPSGHHRQIGKSNMSEFTFANTGENRVFGTPRNPRDRPVLLEDHPQALPPQ
ncbi:hypothetical protein CIT26_00245 [Mesorhizobium temperatum]|uniref:Uncharacterized protein n=1 Tax=Mesorhizobium temperatum TaxID=241416 RepID=A0A271LZ23_9HYPH|nr:hypothetical protein CIT26_00245 [Mesorhizobium temperatum]